MASTAKSRAEETFDNNGNEFSGSRKLKAAVPDAGVALTPKRHRPADVQQPPDAAAQLSLDAAMRAEPETRLYLHPIAWTDRHLKLLRANFDDVRKLGHLHKGSEAGLDMEGSGKLISAPWGSESSLQAIENLLALNAALQRLILIYNK